MLKRMLMHVDLFFTGHYEWCDGCKTFTPPNKFCKCR